MRRRTWTIVLGLAALLALGGGFQYWLHEKFGIFVPWAVPRWIAICDGRYDLGGAPLSEPSGARVETLTATFLNLPLPLPEMHGTDPRLSYNGCPVQIWLDLAGGRALFGLRQGGP